MVFLLQKGNVTSNVGCQSKQQTERSRDRGDGDSFIKQGLPPAVVESTYTPVHQLHTHNRGKQTTQLSSGTVKCSIRNCSVISLHIAVTSAVLVAGEACCVIHAKMSKINVFTSVKLRRNMCAWQLCPMAKYGDLPHTVQVSEQKLYIYLDSSPDVSGKRDGDRNQQSRRLQFQYIRLSR